MEPRDFAWTHLKITGSTNDYAKERVRKREVSGFGAVYADLQTAGRGRGGNPWHSDNDKGLWVTLYFTDVAWNPFDAVMRASLSVAESLGLFGLDCAIKWPNDVIAGRKKICGILAETFDGNIVIGIGVNLRQSAADFPESIRESATSLLLETGAPAGNEEFLDSLLSCFCELEDPEENFRKYSGRLGILNAGMEIGGEEIRIKGVERDGALLGENKSGRIKKYYSGNLRWI